MPTSALENETPLSVFGRVLDCRVQLVPPLTVWMTVPVPVKLPPPTAQPLFASEKQSPRSAYGVGLETADQEAPPFADRIKELVQFLRQHTLDFDIADLPQHSLKEIEHFFHIYKDLEGRRVEMVGWEKSENAMKVILDAIARYEAKFHQVGP